MNSFNRSANSNPNQNAEGFPGDMHNFYFTHNPHANYNFYIATNNAPPPPNPSPTFAPPNVFQQSGFPNNQLMGFQSDRSSYMSMPSSMNTPLSLFQMSPLNSGGPPCFGHPHPNPHHHHHHHGHGHGCSGPTSTGPSTSGRDTASMTTGVSSGCHSPDSSRFGDQRPLFAFVIQDQQGSFGFHPEQDPHPGCICHHFRQSQPQPQPAFGNLGGNHSAAHHCQCANGNRVGPNNSVPAAGGVGGMGVHPGPVGLPRSTSSFSTSSTSAFSNLRSSPGAAPPPPQGGSPTFIIEEPLSQQMSQN